LPVFNVWVVGGGNSLDWSLPVEEGVVVEDTSFLLSDLNLYVEIYCYLLKF
jgi:hypothetical protein